MIIPEEIVVVEAVSFPKSIKVCWHDAIASVEKTAWNRLALDLETPFLEWDWLNLLEKSKSVCPQTGWYPQHLTLWEDGHLIAAAPLYLKDRSEGEFIDDKDWKILADLFKLKYYPKLVGMIPLTPVNGYQFLYDPEKDKKLLTNLMLHQIDQYCQDNQIASIHFLFLAPSWIEGIGRTSFFKMKHQGFHWQNNQLKGFDDYLSNFNTNQRRNIKRDLTHIQQMDFKIEPLVGDNIPDAYFSLMYEYYLNNADRYGEIGLRYLTAAFFKLLPEFFGHRILLMQAIKQEKNQNPIALALFIFKNETLYGRYWGAETYYPYLHFGVCYYEPIKWIIKNKMSRFDPGIGGYHKFRRGFEVVSVDSLHKFYDDRLHRTLSDFYNRIIYHEEEAIIAVNELLPFAKYK